MKKLMMLSAIVASGLIAKSADAQVRFGVDIHLGERPAYIAPAYADQYYYLPDVGAYYSVNQNCYYYNDGYNWVSAAYLPGAYRNYDWQHARRFAVNEARPYLHNEAYAARYGGVEHRDWANRDGRDNRVYANRDERNDRNFIDRDRFENRQPEHRGDVREFEHRDNNQDFGRQPQPENPGGFENHGKQSQPQQNYNRGGQQQQQPAPQQNNGHGEQQNVPAQNNNRKGGNSWHRFS